MVEQGLVPERGQRLMLAEVRAMGESHRNPRVPSPVAQQSAITLVEPRGCSKQRLERALEQGQDSPGQPVVEPGPEPALEFELKVQVMGVAMSPQDELWVPKVPPESVGELRRAVGSVRQRAAGLHHLSSTQQVAPMEPDTPDRTVRLPEVPEVVCWPAWFLFDRVSIA